MAAVQFAAFRWCGGTCRRTSQKFPGVLECAGKVVKVEGSDYRRGV
jgi:hypothetical protein